MKIKETIATLATLCALSFGTAAAQLPAHEITTAQACCLQPIGVISVSGLGGSIADIDQQLAAKAQSQGASAFRIIE
ncbi:MULTISPECIES: YdgH/BhsA/McbA-like domain containing protein [Edwardsiella]|uniref:YdgH/BhsA/McbA-like domain-containing protein n=2 Tax=Edwardsiella anguillarum TaxID=1821960 RepID=A0A076LJ59_9GAMM|nr:MULTISPECIES: YdgH/BhsA/McbA-like domain containing protein [Edwardsiella]AKM46091.1 membrane protein [Edwardsiella sp. EA181011]GAJ67107.1 hypothetical protein MA13_contig00004-0172 [Edwardsiella piscicida]AIJ08585.1 Hypothetical protein ETEE_2141 [Edwardsiella anguillarum ET080813]AKR76632.1 DUF1471 domain-containing protein [Edwardsiella sp. LADL05-105]KAB0592964.1 DUF1471 domain-containing protein [Edwardsiella anguillarum]